MYAKSVRSTDEHGFNIVSALDEHANRAAIKRNITPVNIMIGTYYLSENYLIYALTVHVICCIYCLLVSAKCTQFLSGLLLVDHSRLYTLRI